MTTAMIKMKLALVTLNSFRIANPAHYYIYGVLASLITKKHAT